LLPLCLIALGFAVIDRSVEGSVSSLGGDRLKLLAEVSDEELDRLVEGGGDGNPARRLNRKVCYFVGEAKEKPRILELAESIANEGAETILVERIVKRFGSHMVYVPPGVNIEAARSTLDSLVNDGVEAVLIRDGPNVNGVSLGVFRSEENSAALLEKVRGLGYEVRRRRLSVETSLHGVQVVVPETIHIDESFWQGMRDKNADLQVDEKYCD